jgi:peptidoglycan/LPS O-acetylase OafA/YrhL
MSNLPLTAATSLPRSHPYYPALTGMRAVAAYLVFFLHFRPLAQHVGWADAVISQFYVGVAMFFVLSGFVIATRYQNSVQLNRAWWSQYLWRRFARIYPAYFILNGTALYHVYWPLQAATATNSLSLIFLSQSLLRGFSRTLKFVGIPQGWSLTPEECFYLSAPLLLLAWQRWGRRSAVGFVIIAVGTGLGLTYLCKDRPALHGLFGSYHHLFNFTFFGRVLEFVIGVGLARWWHRRPAQAFTQRWPWLTIGGVLASSAIIIALAVVNPSTSLDDIYDGPLPARAIFLNNVAFPLAIALLYAGLLAEASGLRTLLSTKLMQELGRSSYFFYLLHVGLLSIWWQNTFGWGRHVIWQFLVTMLLAELGFRLLEEPLRLWLLGHTLSRQRTSHAKGEMAQDAI